MCFFMCTLDFQLGSKSFVQCFSLYSMLILSYEFS